MLKKLVLLMVSFVSLSAVCNPYALPSYSSGYVAFTIVNNSGSVTSDNLYVTIIGTDPSNLDSCIVQITSGIGSLVDASQFMFASATPTSPPSTPFSYQVSSLPTQNGLPVVYLPPISNATLYLSVGYGLGLNVSNSAPLTINPPQLFTQADPNYYHLYDSSFFFTIADELTVQSQYIYGFGLPVSTIVSVNSGTSVQYAGVATTSSTLYTDYSNAVSAISNANAKTQWGLLPISFTSAGGSGVSQLRLASPLSGMSFSAPLTPFDTTYLFNSSSYGANWIQTVFETGSPQLFFDVSALTNNTLTYTYYQYTGNTGGNLVFVPGTGCSTGCTNVLIPSTFTTSLPFLNAAATGTGSFNASGDTLAAPLICSYLSTGFVSGLFPVTTSATNLYGTGYLALANINGQFYKNNATFPSGTGPWYDLYAATLHNAAVGTNYFNFQADAVDASLGFFSPITVRNNSNAQPAVFVVLNDLGTTVVPNFTDSNTYSVNIALTPGAGSYTLTYNGMTTPSHTSTMQFTNVPSPFILTLTYSSGIYSGKTFASEIWVNSTNNYSVVFPQPPGTLVMTNEGSGSWNVGVPASP